MNLAHLIAAAEGAAPVLVFAAYSLQRWKTGMRETWREEAEAYKSRAERLDEELHALTAEVRRLSEENEKLRAKIDELLAR
jgi:predicted RNase H-like nuclease (RuvC/YqgF family)